MMSNAGIPLRVIQEISGHNDARDAARLNYLLSQLLPLTLQR